MTGPAVPSRASAPAPFARRLLLVAAAGAALRLAAVLWIPTQPVSDFRSYFARAESLALSGRYEAIPGRADADYPPLYPLLLAGAFLLAGGKTLLGARLVNVALGGIAVAIAGAGSRRLWGEPTGLAAAALLAIFPRSVLMCCLIASENLFTPLLLLFVFLAVEGTQRPAFVRAAALCGAVLGLLALTRTVAYPMGVLWPAGALAGRRRIAAAIGGFVVLLAAQHAVMLPWAIRNAHRIDRFTFLSTGGGYGMFLGNNPNATGDWYDGRADLERAVPGAFSRGPAEASAAAEREAWRWIRAEPRRALALYARKVWLIFRQSYIVADFAISGTNISPPFPGLDALPGPHPLKDHIFAVKRALALFAWGLAAAGLAGFLLLFERARATREATDPAAALVLFLAAACIPFASAVIAVNGRYRWPVEDLLIPVAAVAIARPLSRRTRPAPSGFREPTSRV